jgi:hypothetical protein
MSEGEPVVGPHAEPMLAGAAVIANVASRRLTGGSWPSCQTRRRPAMDTRSAVYARTMGRLLCGAGSVTDFDYGARKLRAVQLSECVRLSCKSAGWACWEVADLQHRRGYDA